MTGIKNGGMITDMTVYIASSMQARTVNITSQVPEREFCGSAFLVFNVMNMSGTRIKLRSY